MAEFDRRAVADRQSTVKQYGDVYAQSGGWAIHWPSQVAEKMRTLIPALGVARAAATTLREIVREIPEHLMDADLARNKLDTADDAALKLADGGFTSAEIADLMDIDARKGEPPALKVDRWRKRVERAYRKVDGTAGTSPSVDSATSQMQSRKRGPLTPTSKPSGRRPRRRP